MNNEHDVVKIVTNKLPIYTRIESASTVTGCPDIYCMAGGHDCFIECKYSDTNKAKVSWRPGQQSWGAKYSYGHQLLKSYHGQSIINYIETKHVLTIVGYKHNKQDYFKIIRERKFFEDSIPCSTDVWVFTRKEFSDLNLNIFLPLVTNFVIPLTDVPYEMLNVCEEHYNSIISNVYKNSDALKEALSAAKEMDEFINYAKQGIDVLTYELVNYCYTVIINDMK